MISAKLIVSVVDELVFTRGEFDPLQFLVAAGLLHEDDHGEWLSGRRSELQSRLQCALDEAVDALERARAYLRAQGLTAQSRRAPRGGAGAQRRVGTSPELVELCSSCLVASGAQKDLFQDSALAATESSVRIALAGHRLGAAKEALALMQELGTPSGATDGYRRLIEAAERDTGGAAERLDELESLVAPLASKWLGHHAFACMAPLWRSLARQLHEAPFQPSSPKLHSSYADLRAAQWQNVIDDIENEAGWLQHPVLAMRLAEAYARSLNRQGARRVWALLCWTHPDAAVEAFGAACADRLLARRWQEFSDAEPELPTRDFPAWLLIADPSHRGFVPASLAPESPTGVAYSAVHRLISNHDDIAARRELKAYNASLLAHYLAYRSGTQR